MKKPPSPGALVDMAFGTVPLPAVTYHRDLLPILNSTGWFATGWGRSRQRLSERTRPTGCEMKFLVLNDEPVMRRFLQRVIGMSVTLEATSPAEALDVCRNNRDIDLLICDVQLGLMSGMELASLMRAWIPELRTILLCDTPCELWKERQNAQLKELPSDAVMILEKPFTTIELKAAITELIGVPEEGLSLGM